MSEFPTLIDIGVNLTHDSFDGDRDQVIGRAFDAGVRQMIVTGSSVVSTLAAIECAQSHPEQLFATAGLHPHHASDWNTATAGALAHAAESQSVVAVGECGLDYFRDLSPRPAQRAAFEGQLEIAARLGKPVFLHQRDAHDDFLAILRSRGSAHTGVAHCFTGDRAQLEAYLELGLHIGITGWICDERRGAHLIELTRSIPAARLLIETDAPYLLPRTLRLPVPTRRNEPTWLPHIAATIAAARAEPLSVFAASSTAAARALFHLPALEASDPV